MDGRSIVSSEVMPEDLGSQLTGKVKWFDAVKGYGFVVPDDDDGDVLLHFSVLRDVGRRSVPEGTTVVCNAVARERGRQATRVQSLDLSTAVKPEDIGRSSFSHPGMDVEVSSDYEAAEVKWFNRRDNYLNYFGTFLLNYSLHDLSSIDK